MFAMSYHPPSFPRLRRAIACAGFASVLFLGNAALTTTGPTALADDRLPGEVTPGAPLPADPWADTTNCPYRENTPPAVDSSEVPAPGQSTPTALPIPTTPVGGEQLGSCGVVAGTGFTTPDRLSFGSWLVFDIDSGAVIAAKDAHGRYRPASIIKVLVALEAIRELPLDQHLKGTWEAANMEGSRAGIGPDGDYTVEQVLLGLMLNSGNDCARMLADAMGGEAETLRKISALATDLGATDSRITSYSGLDAPGLQTSAYDLALFYRAAFSNPTFARLAATKTIDFPGWGENQGFQISSDNGLLWNYDGALGGKTGFTDDARHTYAGAAERDGRRLGVIELNGTKAAGPGWAQGARLLDAAWGATGSVGELVAATSASATPTSSPGSEATDSAASSPDGTSTASLPPAVDHVSQRAVTLGGLAVLIVGAIAAGIAIAVRRARRSQDA